MRTVGARQGSTPRLTFRRRLAAGAALCIATTTAAVVGASVPALALSAGAVTTSRPAAGALTNYTISVTTATALVVDTDTITIVAPTGTVFPAAAAAYAVAGTAPNVAPTVTPNQVVITVHAGVPASTCFHATAAAGKRIIKWRRLMFISRLPSARSRWSRNQ